MSKISNSADLGSIKDANEFIRQASQAIKETVDTVNGKLEFDTNLKTQTVTVTFLSANTNLSVRHSLKKTGVKYFAVKKTAACDVYDGTGQTNSGTMSLKGTTAATVTLILF